MSSGERKFKNKKVQSAGKKENQSSNVKYDEYTDSEQSNVSESMKEIYKVYIERDQEIGYYQALRVKDDNGVPFV